MLSYSKKKKKKKKKKELLYYSSKFSKVPNQVQLSEVRSHKVRLHNDSKTLLTRLLYIYWVFKTLVPEQQISMPQPSSVVWILISTSLVSQRRLGSLA